MNTLRKAWQSELGRAIEPLLNPQTAPGTVIRANTQLPCANPTMDDPHATLAMLRELRDLLRFGVCPQRHPAVAADIIVRDPGAFEHMRVGEAAHMPLAGGPQRLLDRHPPIKSERES